ncbi:MAG: RHS repeat-associated core domain-containing protein [Bacteroidales bacterium]
MPPEKYDNLNRLTKVLLNSAITSEIQYDANGLGNIVQKTVDGYPMIATAGYGEGPAGPHALTSFGTDSALLPTYDQAVEYTSFDKVSKVTYDQRRLDINYGIHDQRVHQVYTDQATGKVREKIYGELFEKVIENGITLETRNYIQGPMGTFAMAVKDERQGSWSLYFIKKDHLGSWEVIPDEMGMPLQQASFDAWGTRRDPDTWVYNHGQSFAPLLFDRGYTGHEHLEPFGLINMNGRVYDPLVSRFLSPDPLIQAPGYTQSFNRYSYGWNNPLRYTDPTGYYNTDQDDPGPEMPDPEDNTLTLLQRMFAKFNWGSGSGGGGYTQGQMFQMWTTSDKNEINQLLTLLQEGKHDEVTQVGELSWESIPETVLTLLTHPVVGNISDIADELGYTKGAGYAYTIFVIGADIYLFQTSQINELQFYYRLSTTGVATYAGWAFGPLVGGTIGFYTTGIEKAAAAGAELELRMRKYFSPNSRNNFWNKFFW